jgi:hypothetical protein
VICSRCRLDKDEREFNYKIKGLGLRQRACRTCTKLQLKDHYYRNKDYYLRKANKRNRILREIIKKYLFEYLIRHPCVDCGEKDPIVLEFDHIKEKAFTLSSFARNHTLEDVVKEVAKCEIRCANCHRRKTAKQFGWHKNQLPL